MKTVTIPEEVIEALAQGIISAVQDRIDNDPDVDDAYLRIENNGNRFTIRCMYIEESNASAPNTDVPLLNLMYDTEIPSLESWIPDEEAIRSLANNYSRLLEFEFFPN